MPRGQTLTVVRTLLKAHIRDAQEVNSSLDTELNALLESVQATLCSQFDWPFMKDRWESTFVAGDRFKALPTTNLRGIASTINLERTHRVYRFHGDVYEPIEHGIGIDEMNTQNSELDERQDPIQKWQLDTNTGDSSNADEFEVWPIPAGAQTVRFEGQRHPRAFSSDSDKCDLDGLMIALFAAAEILQMRDQKAAALKLGQAQTRLIGARAGLPSAMERKLVLGRKYSGSPEIVLIPIAAG